MAIGALGAFGFVAACFPSLDGYSGGGGTAGRDDAATLDPRQDGGITSESDAGRLFDSGSEGGSGDAGTVSAYRSAVLADGPLAYWRLGEAVAGLATDEIGLHPGVYQKAGGLKSTEGATGDRDKAVLFDGVGSINVGDVFDFAGQPFSVELWAKPSSVTTGYRRLVSKERFSPDQGWHFEVSPDLKIDFDIRRDGVSDGLSANVTPDVFTHVVVTFDLSTLRLYLNSVNVASRPTTLGLIATTGTGLTLGGIDGSPEAFLGALDDIALYGKVLTSAQISAHYAAAQR